MLLHNAEQKNGGEIKRMWNFNRKSGKEEEERRKDQEGEKRKEWKMKRVERKKKEL